MQRRFATIILAGGKGTRMGSSDKHKVCFEVLGVPVINRALETYHLCGCQLNIIVVGSQAENVMTTVNQRFQGVVYAFQERALGTGDAARKGAQILERMQFDGDILLVAGDKVIEPAVIRRLLDLHRKQEADVTLATALRPTRSSSGIILKNSRGHIVGILEEAERQRLLGLSCLNSLFRRAAQLSRDEAQAKLAPIVSEKVLGRLLEELWPHDQPAAPLTRKAYEAIFPVGLRAGRLPIAGQDVPAEDICQRFTQINLSTYIFRAPVLFDALSRLKSSRPNQEEYLTDVFELLAKRQSPARIIGCEIADTRDLMAFNNPQELMAIEVAARERAGRLEVSRPATANNSLAAAQIWANLLQSPSPAAQRQFRQWYGENAPPEQARHVLQAFIERFGPTRQTAIIRSPGRINLLGRHIDHQGGSVNVMAINREITMIAAPRQDDLVTLVNVDSSTFAEHKFRISDLIARLDWDDWLQVIDGPRLRRMLEAARGDWANYIKAAILRLQEQFRDRHLCGMDIVLGGNIPMGAGLSSSSALVVATAEATIAFNHLPVSDRRLVSLCGEGEWFVGTRGGAADHAAIKLSRRGHVTRVGFFPFRIEDSARFFPDYELVVCNSGIYAGKSAKVRNQFNEKVTSYHIGRSYLKMMRPDLAPRIQHLRDVLQLGLKRAELFRLLAQLPERLSRQQVETAFGQMAEAERAKLQHLFASHDAPPRGYPVREVVLYGLAEIARASRCLDLLKACDARGLGRLMKISHDGDRVSRELKPGQWRRVEPENGDLTAKTGDLADVPGAYACSLPELDRIADTLSRLPGVAGAQLAGAGLGGCIMALAHKDHSATILQTLRNQGIQAEVFRPIAGVGTFHVL